MDHRADLFSLGAVLYALGAGHPPFAGGNPIAVLRNVCDTDPRPLRQLRPDLPRWLVRAIERLLGKDPAARFASAADLAACLEAGPAAGRRGFHPHRRVRAPALHPGMVPPRPCPADPSAGRARRARLGSTGQRL